MTIFAEEAIFAKRSEPSLEENRFCVPRGLLQRLRSHLADCSHTFEAKTKKLAVHLHESGYLYLAYGALDGLSNAYTIWKYLFDIAYCNTAINASEALHDWMRTPEGLFFVALETFLLVTCSAMGNFFDDEDKNVFKRSFALYWPYVRHTIKGAKNAFKGLRTSMQVCTLLSGVALQHLLVPASLFLGLAAIVNRLLLKRMQEKSKAMLRKNSEILMRVKEKNIVNQKICRQMRRQVVQHKSRTRNLAFLGVAFGGLVDGMYMYFGLLGLIAGAVAPPLLFFMLACSALYLIACIVTRIYEEYYHQSLLDISVTKIELALSGKLLSTRIKDLKRYQNNSSDPNSALYEEADFEALRDELKKELENFASLHEKLLSYQLITWKRAFLMGIRHGLYAYGALTSCIFAVATILLLFSIAMPAPVLIGSAVAGLVLLGVFIAHALYKAHDYRQRAQKLDNDSKETIEELVKTINDHKKLVDSLETEQIKDRLFGYMTVDPSPQFFFQEWFEVVRSFFSGIGKGTKFFNTYQDANHDNAILLSITAVSSAIFAICLSLRALCKGFGRPPVDAVRKSDQIPSEQQMAPDPIPTEVNSSDTPAPRKSLTPKVDKSTKPYSLSTNSLFKRKPLSAPPSDNTNRKGGEPTRQSHKYPPQHRHSCPPGLSISL